LLHAGLFVGVFFAGIVAVLNVAGGCAAMKRVERRLDRLEDRLAPQGRNQLLIVVTDARQKLALDSGRCVQILRDAGHLDTTSCVVDLGYIPDGLNAAELDRYLRAGG
jgi:hypothetical protein